MKIIRIRRTWFIAYIDDEDYDLVMSYKWYIYPFRAPTYYACTGGKGPPIFMHRLILPAPPKLPTTHKNGNGLDNRRCNLVHATHMENMQNKRMYANNVTGITGVKYHDNPQFKRKWEAQIGVHGKRISLGCYHTREEAAAARKAAELKYRGGQHE